MGAIWLHDLPDVIDAAGLDVEVWSGWESRSRSSGGYDGLFAVFVHHTASDASPEGDMRYMWDATGGDQPIGALYLARDGIVTVGAAGATNCQGKGGPWTLSRGTIPLDKGNAYGIAIEAANDGVGEPWPDAQTDAYPVLVGALCDAYGLDVRRDVLAHFEWVEPSCPGRKVDPVGPSPWATGAQSWDMGAFRADAAAPIPEPEPPTNGDEVTDDDIARIAEATALTDDDIERIAARAAELVWKRQTVDQTVNKPVTTEALLQYTRNAAANADKQTKA